MGGFFRLTVDSASEFIRYKAWLNAPYGDDKKTRFEDYKDTEFANSDPDDYAVWLINLASDCGFVSHTGMGVSAISWQEINAWQEATGLKWPWLASVIHRLSIDYVNEYVLAKDVHRPSPLQVHIDLIDQREKVAQQIKNIFKSGR